MPIGRETPASGVAGGLPKPRSPFTLADRICSFSCTPGVRVQPDPGRTGARSLLSSRSLWPCTWSCSSRKERRIAGRERVCGIRPRRFQASASGWTPGSIEAKRFGAATSGLVLVYNASAKLVFPGRYHSLRGHEGDNAGSSGQSRRA